MVYLQEIKTILLLIYCKDSKKITLRTKDQNSNAAFFGKYKYNNLEVIPSFELLSKEYLKL